MKTKALILLAHPDMRESNLNRHLASQAATQGDVTVHDLYKTYPDEIIDVAREQRLLREHSVVIFQLPASPSTTAGSCPRAASRPPSSV